MNEHISHYMSEKVRNLNTERQVRSVRTGERAWESEWQALPALQATLFNIKGMSWFTFMPEFHLFYMKIKRVGDD
jgi:hypothetical protein